MGLVRSMADEMAKEIGNKTREFYEFVLPPVDMRLGDDALSVIIDMPGFDKKDIRLSLEENVLSIQACKEEDGGTPGEKDSRVICSQRPNVIDKKLRLPVDLDGGRGGVSSAKYEDGVLTVVVPVQKNSTDIKID